MTQAAIARILARVLDAYDEVNDPGMSDLDNEQPVALHIHILLGDIRAIRSLAYKERVS